MEPQYQPQKLYTKKFGELEVMASWAEPPNHIALLSNGSYVHITGVPIVDKSVLRKTLPIDCLQEALDWFDHRHENKAPESMRIMIEADGSFAYEDGTPITSISQLTQALQPGAILDAALSWFTRKQDAEKAAVGKKNVDPKKPPVVAKPQGAARKVARKKAKEVAKTASV